MTKSIEDELNLPRIADALKQLEEDNEDSDDKPEFTEEDLNKALANMSEMKNSLKKLDDFSENEQKITEIQELAIQSHKDLLDAGFQVEAKNAGQYLEPAMQSLNIAMETERTKINNKLKMIQLKIEQDRLELQRRKVELAEKQFAGTDAEVLSSNEDGSFMAKREEILKALQGQDK